MDAKMVECSMAQFKNALKKFNIFVNLRKNRERTQGVFLKYSEKEFRHSTCI